MKPFKKIGFACVVICFCLINDLVWADTELQSIPLPPSARIELISNNIQQNGGLLKISKFYADDSLQDVLSFYKSLWYREGEIPGYLENRFESWSLISQLDDEHSVVFQLQSNNENKTEGYLSIATLNQNRRLVESEFPLQDGAETFSRSTSNSDGKNVETHIMLSPQAVSDTVTFYKVKMFNLGWSLVRASSLNGTEVLVFNDGIEHCELAISRLNNASTVIYLNRIRPYG